MKNEYRGFIVGRYEELKGKGTKIEAADLESVDINTLWKLAAYYSEWLIEDPDFNRLRKVYKMIQKEIDKRYLIQDDYLRKQKGDSIVSK